VAAKAAKAHVARAAIPMVLCLELIVAPGTRVSLFTGTILNTTIISASASSFYGAGLRRAFKPKQNCVIPVTFRFLEFTEDALYQNAEQQDGERCIRGVFGRPDPSSADR
jgi:hypothetical protein